MLKNLLTHRGFTAHVVPGVVASGVGVLALYAAAHRFLPGSLWVEAGLVVGLAAIMTVVVAFLLSRYFVRPIREKLELAEATLERAALMQEAMKPALSLLADGLARQYAILDDLSVGLPAHLDRADSESDSADSKPPSGFRRRVLLLAATVKDLRKDAASRAQIANTLMAANETVGLRHSELHTALGALRSSVNGQAKPASSEPTPSPASEPIGGPVPIHGDAMLPPSEPYSDFSTGSSHSEADPGAGYSWPSESFEPLMSDFKIPKTQGRERFGRN